MKVNVLDAKNRLSELIRAAQAGEDVIIANRGEPVARLMPITAPRGAVIGSAEALLRWIEATPQPDWVRRKAEEIDADIESERGAWD